MGKYQDFHKRSIGNRDDFWAEQAQLVEWKEPFTQVCDFSRPPFVKWFVNGKTNLCYNAVDRHAAERPNDRALVYISTETDEERVYTWAELQREVERMAAILQSQDVKEGDRVLIYMPMITLAGGNSAKLSDSSTRCLYGTGLPLRIPASAVTMTFGLASSIRVASEPAAKPPNTTE